MFLHLSVILFTGGSLSTGVFGGGEVSVQGGLCPGESLSGGGLCPGYICLVGGISVQGVSVYGSVSTGVSVRGDLCPPMSSGSLSRGGITVWGGGGSLSRGSLSWGSLSRGGISIQGSLSGGVSLSMEVSVKGGICQGDPPMLLYGYVRAVRILLECILVFYMYC